MVRVIRILPEKHGGWAVWREGERRPVSLHATRWAAELAAASAARRGDVVLAGPGAGDRRLD